MMNRQEAIDFIRRELPRAYFRRDGSGKGFICPICNSGAGPKGTGITTKDGIHFTCWTGCFQNQDIFSIIGVEYGLNDFTEQFKYACRESGIDYDSLEKDFQEPIKKAPAKVAEPQPPVVEQEESYEAFFEECSKHLDETDYLLKRGLSRELQRAFNIGYCEKWVSPKALKEYESGTSQRKPIESKRVIIPTSPFSYIARAVEASEVPKMKTGKIHLFNIDALRDAKEGEVIFITEGEIDALSIMQAVPGTKAVATGSVTMVNKFVEYAKASGSAASLAVFMDNDEAGTRAEEVLKAKLDEAGLKCFVCTIKGTHKDANEELVNGNLKEVIMQNIEIINGEKDQALQEYIKDLAAAGFEENFEAELIANLNIPSTSTGFCGLDEVLNGGLKKGLYFIGGISSLGKTTFCMQVADNIAKSGTDILFFSLEMAKSELMAKSISRYTYIKTLEADIAKENAQTTNTILYGNKDALTPAQKGIYTKAKEAYFQEVAPCFYIYEGVGNIGAEKIKEAVEKHIAITGRKPVVFIDYLQIMAPYNEKYTDKQNIDKTVLELKRISRDKGIPIIAISSFNRESYSQAVTMASFKESGAVEYTSDVLIGLQYFGMDRSEADKSDTDYAKRARTERELQETKGRNGEPQHLQVKILKNRNGKKGSVEFYFLPGFNYFYEDIPFEKNVVKRIVEKRTL